MKNLIDSQIVQGCCGCWSSLSTAALLTWPHLVGLWSSIGGGLLFLGKLLHWRSTAKAIGHFIFCLNLTVWKISQCYDKSTSSSHHCLWCLQSFQQILKSFNTLVGPMMNMILYDNRNNEIPKWCIVHVDCRGLWYKHSMHSSQWGLRASTIAATMALSKTSNIRI